HALLSCGIKFGILDMEHLDPFVINIDKLNIIQALKQEMAGIIQYIGTGVVADMFQKPLKSNPVVKVLSWMKFITQVIPVFLKCIQYRRPSPCQFLKPSFHQSCGPLGPGVYGMPHQCPAESGMF